MSRPTPLQFFRELSAIPRVSGNEKGAADFVEKIALTHGCEVYRDSMHNLIVTKPASPGCKNPAPFMMQGHLDMVGECDPGVEHDFSKDPIQLIEENGILRAAGTTLGADDGIAVAIMLCALTDPELVHPALECVFTVQEETGLYGAMALDTSRLKARHMLNLDAGPEGIFVAACAGGCRVSLERPLIWEENDCPMWELEVSGLEGGHSGGMISRQGANALVIMGILLQRVLSCGGRIGGVFAGDKDNVIPNRARAAICMEADPSSVLEPVVKQIRSVWGRTDPKMQIILKQIPAERLLRKEDGIALTQLLRLLPHGVVSYSNDMPGLVETSANLAVARTAEALDIHLSLRSSADFRKQMLIDQVETLAGIYGAECTFSGVYPGWSYAPESALRDMAIGAFERVYGYQPEVQGIHAGLECGVLKGAIPDLDIIATGPKYAGMHTTGEWMDIESMSTTYRFVQELLRTFAEQR